MSVRPKKDHAFHLSSRPDARGSEKLKDRPWLLLSDEECHRSGLIIGIPTTTTERQYAFFVESGLPVKQDPNKPRKRSRYDPRQPWTRLVSDIEYKVDSDPRNVHALREKLLHLLQFREDELSATVRQGRVVWLHLEPRFPEASRDQLGAPLPAEGSDVQMYERAAHATLGLSPSIGKEWRIPCVVLSSKKALIDARGLVEDIITVCPLAPIANPSDVAIVLQQPGTKALFTPLTVCLMSIDPEARTPSGKPRLDHDRLPWCVPPDTMLSICRRVLWWLGIERIQDEDGARQSKLELERTKALLPFLPSIEDFSNAPNAETDALPRSTHRALLKSIGGLSLAGVLAAAVLHRCPASDAAATKNAKRQTTGAPLANVHDTQDDRTADALTAPSTTEVVDDVLRRCSVLPNGFDIKKCLIDEAEALPKFEDAQAVYRTALTQTYNPTGLGNRSEQSAGTVGSAGGRTIAEAYLEAWQDMVAHGGLAALYSRFGRHKEAGIELARAFEPRLTSRPAVTQQNKRTPDMPRLTWWDCLLWRAVERRARGGASSFEVYDKCYKSMDPPGAPSSGQELTRYEIALAHADIGQHQKAADAFATLLTIPDSGVLKAMHSRWKHLEPSNLTIRTDSEIRLRHELRALATRQQALLKDGAAVWMGSPSGEDEEQGVVVVIAVTDIPKDDEDCENIPETVRRGGAWSMTVETDHDFVTELYHPLLGGFQLGNELIWIGRTFVDREPLQIAAGASVNYRGAETEPPGCRNRHWDLLFCLWPGGRLSNGSCR